MYLAFSIYIQLGLKAFPYRACQRFLTELLQDPVQSHKKFWLDPQNNFTYTRKNPKLTLVWKLFTDSSAEIAAHLREIYSHTG